jgi:hypothetical protein
MSPLVNIGDVASGGSMPHRKSIYLVRDVRLHVSSANPLFVTLEFRKVSTFLLRVAST